MPLSQNKLLVIDITENDLLATLKVNEDMPPVAMSAEEVLGDLQRLKICVDEEQLTRIRSFAKELAKGVRPKPIVVATGTAPTDDQPGKVEMLALPHDGSKASKSVAVDYRKISNIPVVTSGDEIARSDPPIKGADGVDIYGRAIPHKKGSESESESITPGPNTHRGPDGRIIYASASGKLNVQGGKVWIDTVLKIQEDVDFSTGSIDFPGDVQIGKNVKDLFVVKSSGSILVNGVAQAANIEALKELTVLGGIAGNEKGKFIAGGGVTSKYITNAVVQADGDVNVRSEIANSKITCEGSLRVSDGSLAGGHATALCGIDCNVLGSESAVKTVAEIHLPKSFLEESVGRISEIAKLQSQAKKVRTTVEPLLQDQKKLNARQRERATELLYEAMENESRAEELAHQVQEQYDKLKALSPEIIISGQVYPGVIIRFPTVQAEIKDAITGPVKIRVSNAKGKEPVVVAVHEANDSIKRLDTKQLPNKALSKITRYFSGENDTD